MSLRSASAAAVEMALLAVVLYPLRVLDLFSCHFLGHKLAPRNTEELSRRTAQIEPHERALIVLNDALAVFIQRAKLILRLRIALFRRELVPLGRGAEVLRHALAMFVCHTEIVLGGRIPSAPVSLNRSTAFT
jgi:hypothetical protein